MVSPVSFVQGRSKATKKKNASLSSRIERGIPVRPPTYYVSTGKGACTACIHVLLHDVTLYGMVYLKLNTRERRVVVSIPPHRYLTHGPLAHVSPLPFHPQQIETLTISHLGICSVIHLFPLWAQRYKLKYKLKYKMKRIQRKSIRQCLGGTKKSKKERSVLKSYHF